MKSRDDKKPVVTLSVLVTGTGDDGTTALSDGTRVPKNHPRVAAYGEVDSLNALVGRAYTRATAAKLPKMADQLSIIQNELYDLGSELSYPPGKIDSSRITEVQIQRVRGWVKEITDSLPKLTSFALPGGSELNDALHECRTFTRQVERSIKSLDDHEPVSQPIKTYLNRLSDLFFAMARVAAKEEKITERVWEPGKTR